MQKNIILNNLINNVNINKIYFNRDNINCELYFNMDLADIKDFNIYFIDKINKNNINNLTNIFPSTFEKLSEVTTNTVSTLIFTGHILLYIPENDILYKISLINVPERSISEPLFDPINVYGSRDGFVESIKKNLGLIQRKLKSDNLVIKSLNIGRRTKTEVDVLYVDDIANKKSIKEVIERLNRIDVGSVTSINTITNEFTKKELFPLVGETGSPEAVCNNLLKGKIAILIDQFPIAILVPITVDYFTTSSESTNAPVYYSLYTRTITYVLLFLSVFFLGLFIAIVNYHSSDLSLLIISEIKVTARGITIPLSMEILLTLLIFDILKMSNIKTPSSNIQNVIVIVGGLLIGQNTINSGFIGAFNLVITAICYLSTFGVTNNQHIIVSLSIFRLVLVISSILLGLYGFLITSLLIICYINNLKSLNVPYLSPLSPLFFSDIVQSLLPKDSIKNKKRPEILKTIDKDYGK